jgi:2,5-furandicarboxylate decarboxylase 1
LALHETLFPEDINGSIGTDELIEMSYQDYLNRLKSQGRLTSITEPVSKTFQVSALLKKLEPNPVLFDHVVGSQFRITGNLFCSKASFAGYFGMQKNEIIPRLIQAITQPTPCQQATYAACQEIIDPHPNLDDYPILRHFPLDGGNYITSGVVIARHPHYGQNLSFHRLMQFSENQMAMRVVAGRHFDRYLNELEELDVAVCIGVSPNVLAAAATSVDLGINELEIAYTLEPFTVVKAQTSDLYIPAESEFVLEGRVYLERTHPEGPFVDLTETEDIVREQPVFEVKTITHREDAIWQALLPGGLEHKLLMGMPREPTIYQQVSQVVKCLDVHVNPGGCSWLHAIVKIDKHFEDDGKKAIRAAFTGHRSCKHVFVVDADIDIYNPEEVEWALATRFQADRDLVILDRERGSSLDPSAAPESHLTTKVGFDLTKPLDAQGKKFEKVHYPEIDVSKYLPNVYSK